MSDLFLILDGSRGTSPSDEFKATISVINDGLNYPGLPGVTYTNAVKHPSPSDTRLLIVIQQRALPYLSTAQIADLKDLGFITADGWISMRALEKSEDRAWPNWLAFAAALSATTGALAAAHFLLHWF